MNEAFEKILERLEELRQNQIKELCEHRDFTSEMQSMRGHNILQDAKKIVQAVAEEYKDGWIACSERLPEDDSICIVTVEYPNNKTMVDYGWFDRKNVCWFVGMQEFRTSNILAWQPLPEQYSDN